MDWIEWMWKVDVVSGCGCGKWIWKVESGAVPDLTLLLLFAAFQTELRRPYKQNRVFELDVLLDCP